jgi:hypothetical protein
MITMYCQSCGKKLQLEPTVGGAWMCSCGSSWLSSEPKPDFVFSNGPAVASLPIVPADALQIRPIFRYELGSDGTENLTTWNPPGENPTLHVLTPDPED